VPGETDPRADVSLAAFSAGLRDHVAVGQLVAGVKEPGRGIDEMWRLGPFQIPRLDELVRAVVQIGDSEIRLPAQAEIQGQPGSCTERVASVKAQVMAAPELDLAVALPELAHRPQDVIGLVKSSDFSVESEITRAQKHVVLVIPKRRRLAAPGEA